MTAKTGHCLCGAVGFTAEVVESSHHACHCGMCRRWTGGPFLTTTARGVVFDGTENLVRYASSTWAERGFCRICGSTLFYFLLPTGTHMLSVGAFDDPTPFRLTEEIFIDHKPDGYAFAGDHPRLTEAQTLAKYAPG
ncbi:MAG: GFA family protein [Labilithrix sp.]|nr:GFA family protein [Labilithrix sp.]